MQHSINRQYLNSSLGILLLRLIFGGLFTWHGLDALMHYNQYLAMSTSTIGLPVKFEFALVVFSQFICGLLIVVGFLTRLAVIPIFICMALAFLIAHKGMPFYQKELPFVYALLCIVIAVLGSGIYSADHFIQKRKASR